MSDTEKQLRAIADELRKEHEEGYLCIYCFDGQIMAKCIADAADEILRLRAENAALTAAVERVRALHKPPRNTFESVWLGNDGQPLLLVCDQCGDDLPCSTLSALEETP